MPPLTRINRNALSGMIRRQNLMQKPDSYFSRFCNGRIPSPIERLHCIEQAILEMTPAEVYGNDLYEVQLFRHLPFLHLTISRRDGGRCTDREHFQQIKNQIIGAEYEAVELFPAQSRMVDSGNEYHLWVYANPGFRFPVNYEGRSAISRAARVVGLAGRMS